MMTQPNTAGLAPIVALATAILICLATIAVMLTSPATIPMWCAAHGGCP
jgi:hypothetical protein